MSPPHNSSRPKRLWKRPWIVFTAIAAAAATPLAFVTGAIEIVEKVVDWSSPPSIALVRITTEPVLGGPTCLRFSFERLPSEFTLGKIRFTVLAASEFRFNVHPEPETNPRIAARPVHRQHRQMQVPTHVMNGQVDVIEHAVDVQSDKENDAAIVSLCPVPVDSGISARLTVVPSFVSLAGNPIENIEASTHDGSPIGEGLDLAVAPYPRTSGPDFQTK